MVGYGAARLTHPTLGPRFPGDERRESAGRSPPSRVRKTRMPGGMRRQDAVFNGLCEDTRVRGYGAK